MVRGQNVYDPFGVALDIHSVPGALPPAIHCCPFRATKTKSPEGGPRNETKYDQQVLRFARDKQNDRTKSYFNNLLS